MNDLDILIISDDDLQDGYKKFMVINNFEIKIRIVPWEREEQGITHFSLEKGSFTNYLTVTKVNLLDYDIVFFDLKESKLFAHHEILDHLKQISDFSVNQIYFVFATKFKIKIEKLHKKVLTNDLIHKLWKAIPVSNENKGSKIKIDDSMSISDLLINNNFEFRWKWAVKEKKIPKNSYVLARNHSGNVVSLVWKKGKKKLIFLPHPNDKKRYLEYCLQHILEICNKLGNMYNKIQSQKDFIKFNLKKKSNKKKTLLNEKPTKRISNDEMFDFALSFAGEDRKIVKQIANKMVERGIKVFYDGFYKAELLGKDLVIKFKEIYAEKSEYVVIFVSDNYEKKLWTNYEFEIARKAIESRKEDYILPIKLDDTILFGLKETIAHIDFKKEGVESTVKILCDKLKLSDTKLKNKEKEKKTNRYDSIKKIIGLLENYENVKDIKLKEMECTQELGDLFHQLLIIGFSSSGNTTIKDNNYEVIFKPQKITHTFLIRKLRNRMRVKPYEEYYSKMYSKSETDQSNPQILCDFI